MDKIPFIERGNTGSLHFHRSTSRVNTILFTLYILGICAFFIAATARLFHLTVARGEYYFSLSEQNRVRDVIIEAKRGEMVDRKGVVLAFNDEPKDATSDARLTSRRHYPFNESMSHLLGYRQDADEGDFKHDLCVNKLTLGDKTGKKGVEKLMECELRGEHGRKLIEVDAHGTPIRTLHVIPPVQGRTITLALDSYLQEIAYKQMLQKKGAVIALKPKTGEILTLLSSPSFNLDAFENSSSSEINSILQDKDKLLFNRASEGTYPPGSTFKLFVAAAGLQEKAVKPDTLIEDNGFIKAGPLIFHNWYYLEYGKTEGEVDVVKALQRSNDIYFYELGAKLQPEKIKKWGELFGLHTRTAFGLEEAEGVLPSSFWKEDTLNEKWYLGDTYNLAIGQGYVSATPLQIALGTAAFANGGYYCKPLLFKKDTPFAQPVNCRKIPMAKSTYDLVRKGMKAACEEGGTGWPFFDFPVRVGCKTGTSESHALSGKPHAWFTVFAPFDDPEIVMTVLVEESGQGSDVAAPIAKEVLKAFFERKE